MDSQLLERASQWLDAHDPARALVSDALLSGADAGMPVVTAATLVGSERGKALAASKAIKAAGATDEGLEVFKQDAMNGATSILEICRLNAGYNPLDIDDKERKAKHDLYIKKVLTAPFFSLVYSDAQKISNSSKNWDALISAVTDTFVGIAAEDKKQVATALGSLAKAAASSSHSSQKEDLFVQSVLKADTGEYDIFIYTSHVELSVDEEKGSTTKQSVFELSRAKLRFRAVEWPYLAEKVWKKKVKTTDDWLDENTTKDGSLATNLCLAVLKS